MWKKMLENPKMWKTQMLKKLPLWFVIHVRKNTWFHVIVAKTKMLLIAIKNLMLVAKSAKNC